MNGYEYEGDELEIFAEAMNWKKYFKSQIGSYIRGRVLEVGAGIGATTAHLANDDVSAWLGLEPDARLATQCASAMAQLPRSNRFTCKVGTLDGLDLQDRFDCILYIDVLEHIHKDREELQHASRFLAEGGAIVVLSPAHQSLFSPFDKAVGHCRRYSAVTLERCSPEHLVKERLFFLDSVGLLASVSNMLLLRQSLPTRRQIRTWDRLMIPLSRVLDPLILHRLGRSIVCVWRRPAPLTTGALEP